jgi:hypothetical protein
MNVVCGVVFVFVALFLIAMPFVIKESYFQIIKGIEEERKKSKLK